MVQAFWSRWVFAQRLRAREDGWGAAASGSTESAVSLAEAGEDHACGCAHEHDGEERGHGHADVVTDDVG